MSQKTLLKEEFLHYLKNREEAKSVSGNFLCFFMIPVIQRFGQWRFAGTAYNLDEAIQKIEEFGLIIDKQYREIPDVSSEPIDKNWFLDFVAESEVLVYCKQRDMQDSYSLDSFKERNIFPVEALTLAEGEAPYDDEGFAILEVGNLESHPYRNRPLESVIPKAWSGGDWEADVDAIPETFFEKA